MNAISEHHSCLLSLPNEPKGTYRHTEQRGSSISSPLLRYRLSRDDNNLFTFTVVNSPLGGWGGNRERRKKKKSKGKKKKKKNKKRPKESSRSVCAHQLCRRAAHTACTQSCSGGSPAVLSRSAAPQCASHGLSGAQSHSQALKGTWTAMKRTYFVQIIQREENEYFFLLKMIFYSKVLNIVSFALIGITFKKI